MKTKTSRVALTVLVVALAACSVVDPFGDFRVAPPDASVPDVSVIDTPSVDEPVADVTIADAGFDAPEAPRDAPVEMDAPDVPPPDVMDVVTVRDAPDVVDVVTLRDVPDVTDANVCGAGLTLCGRCVDTQTDMANCGRCGYICQSRPNTASVACMGGACVLGCTGGFGNCDASEPNGCETDLRASALHCGRCGNACPRGQVCTGSMCAPITCPANMADCDLDVTNGCEASLLADANHCGRCGMQCPIGNGCFNGTCQDFAGTFTLNMMPPCPNMCAPSNSFSGATCTCPPGFRAGWFLQLLSTCGLGTATASRSSLYICGPPTPGRFAGSYQIDTMTGSCVSQNTYLSPAGCGCPMGTASHTFNVSTMGGVYATTICLNMLSSGARSSFGGFYVQDAIATDAGFLCRVANPLSSGCTCPMGTAPLQGTRFFWLSTDMRERSEAEIVFCAR
jgi:hypothetical protein